jgi:hypothetical protein
LTTAHKVPLVMAAKEKFLLPPEGGFVLTEQQKPMPETMTIQHCLLPRTQSLPGPHPGNNDDFLRVLIYSDLDDDDELENN